MFVLKILKTISSVKILLLNYDVMKQDILSELDHPLETRRAIPVVNPNDFKRDQTHTRIALVEQRKEYGLETFYIKTFWKTIQFIPASKKYKPFTLNMNQWRVCTQKILKTISHVETFYTKTFWKTFKNIPASKKI